MNCRDLLCISILIFCTTTNAAPPAAKKAPTKWQQLANNPRFLQYRATLLSQEVMPFLSDCYSPECCGQNDEYSCSLYFDVVSWAQEMLMYPNVTRELVKAAVKRPPVTEFCTALSSKYNETSTKFGHKLPFDEASRSPIVCIIACGDFSTLAKPPCATSLWLLDAISAAAEAMKKTSGTTKKDSPGSSPKSENAALESEGANGDSSLPIALGDKGKSKVPLQLPKGPADEGAAKLSEPSVKAAPSRSEQAEPPKDATKVKGEKAEKPIPQPITPSDGDFDRPEDVGDVEPPVAGSKSTTEPAPAPVRPDAEDKKEKQPYDPSMGDYDDDMASNENKPNQADQMDELNEPDDSVPKLEVPDMAQTQKVDPDLIIVDGFKDDPSSNFFFYFLFGMFMVIVCYVAYNNKSKIVALILEGRRAHGGRGGRRKHTAAYRKLDSNLEEAIMSAPSGRTTQVIY